MKPTITEFECDNQFEKAEIAWEAVLEEFGDGAVFKPLHVPGVDPSDTRPLLIWVHPGDACEDDSPDTRIRRRSVEHEHSPPKLTLWTGFLTLHRPKGWTR